MADKSVSSTKKESILRHWAPLGVLSLALAIILLDATILNVSLATIIRDVNTNIESIQWVITAYSLTLAALTITGGRLGDLFGRKKMFVTGAIIFAVGSFIMSIANTVPVMVLGESIIEGIGGAMMMPATASLLIAKYQGRERSIAFGFWGGVAGAATAIGPLLGGFLTTYYSWRWSFRINVFVVAVLILGSFLITESRDEREKPRLDWLGVILSSLGLLGVVFGIIESTDYGWFTAKKAFMLFGQNWNFGGYSVSFYTILIGLVLLAAFLVWENFSSRFTTPLVSLKLFVNRQFTSGMATIGILALGQAGLVFSIPVFLQAVRGQDAFHTGLVMLPMSLTAFVVAPLAGYLSHKLFQPKRLVQLGLLLNVIGYTVLRYSLNVNATNQDLVLGMIILGAGIGLGMAQLNNITLSAVSHQQAGEASGVNNTFRQLGTTLGTAVIGAVLLTAISTNITNGINNSKVIPSFAKSSINSQVSEQTSNVEFGGGAKIPASVSPVLKNEIISISHNSITDANREALLYAAIFAFVGFIVSFVIPNQNMEHGEELT